MRWSRTPSASSSRSLSIELMSASTAAAARPMIAPRVPSTWPLWQKRGPYGSGRPPSHREPPRATASQREPSENGPGRPRSPHDGVVVDPVAGARALEVEPAYLSVHPTIVGGVRQRDVHG